MVCPDWIVQVTDSFPFLRSPPCSPPCSPRGSFPCVTTPDHLSEPPVVEFEVFEWMHLISSIFRRYSSRVIVPVDSTIAEPFVLRCLAKAAKTLTVYRQETDHSIALDPFLFATQGTIIAQQHSRVQSLPQSSLSQSSLSQSSLVHIQDGLNDDDLKDTLIPILYHKCNLDTLNAMMDRLDKQYYEQSEGESQWGFCVFWSSARGALAYEPPP